ncbi:MAG TPA: hypothetical protein PKO33_01130 [Pyrinomonadaceae bacterium]|nr:hypothetical protein [Pyrinomonadaceae bacterium]HNU06334.1 hypothetical protein [Pyrinomonadaceae bacterium]
MDPAQNTIEPATANETDRPDKMDAIFDAARAVVECLDKIGLSPSEKRQAVSVALGFLY